MKRICPKCSTEKIFDDFYINKESKKPSSWCKCCVRHANRINSKKTENKEKQQARHKKWVEKNKDSDKERKRLWVEENKGRVSKTKSEWYEKNKERISKEAKIRFQKNKKKIYKTRAKYRKLKYDTDPLYKLDCIIRDGVKRVSHAIKKKKNARSHKYLGCTVEEFKKYIESLWQDGMSWGNHGVDGWHIDHKIPLDWFIKNSDNPWEANHYKNLQPMWAKDNLDKSNKLN